MDYWTIEDNIRYRNFIKEGKSIEDIKSLMGDRLKFNSKFISTFSKFIKEEISYSMRNTIYSLDFSLSQLDNNKQNYHVSFKTIKGNDYIVDFIYIKDSIGPYKNIDCYNISFTISKNHNLSNDSIYEQPTGENEQNEVLSKVLFIINSICSTYKIDLIIVGLTDNKTKDRIYLDMINSINKEYSLGKSSINNGKDVYYINFQVN